MILPTITPSETWWLNHRISLPLLWSKQPSVFSFFFQYHSVDYSQFPQWVWAPAGSWSYSSSLLQMSFIPCSKPLLCLIENGMSSEGKNARCFLYGFNNSPGCAITTWAGESLGAGWRWGVGALAAAGTPSVSLVRASCLRGGRNGRHAHAAAFQPLGLLICHSFSLGGLNKRQSKTEWGPIWNLWALDWAPALGFVKF